MSEQSSLLAPLVEPTEALTDQQARIGARHMSLPGVGKLGQRRLAAARILLVGAGGLGSPLALYLAAAGVGNLGIVDGDLVEESNLQRQVIHRWQGAGENKAQSATAQILSLNPSVSAQAYPFYLDAQNIEGLLGQYDLVIDGSDNFATRYLVADACEMLGKPLIWGTLSQYTAQVSVFWSAPRYLDGSSQRGWGLRDLYSQMPDPQSVPTCAAGGVLGSLCGTIGSVMATEAIKLITGLPDSLLGKLWLFDARTVMSRTLTICPDPQRPLTTSLDCVQAEIEKFAAEQVVPSVSLEHLKEYQDNYRLVDLRTEHEREEGHYPGDWHLPLNQFVESLNQGKSLNDLLEGSPDLPVVFYCAKGVRSVRAVKLALAADPDQDVYSLDGGWKPF